MDQTDVLQIRDAHDDERDALRDVTLAAYQEYAAVLPEPIWVGYRRQLLATLNAEAPAERIVAEQHGAIVGSVLLFPPAANAYAGNAASVDYPEVRLLAVVPAARGKGVGAALIDECARRARRAGATTLGLHTMDMMRAAVRMNVRTYGLRARARPRLRPCRGCAREGLPAGPAHVIVEMI